VRRRPEPRHPQDHGQQAGAHGEGDAVVVPIARDRHDARREGSQAGGRHGLEAPTGEQRVAGSRQRDDADRHPQSVEDAEDHRGSAVEAGLGREPGRQRREDVGERRVVGDPHVSSRPGLLRPPGVVLPQDREPSVQRHVLIDLGELAREQHLDVGQVDTLVHAKEDGHRERAGQRQEERRPRQCDHPAGRRPTPFAVTGPIGRDEQQVAGPAAHDGAP
jgi:hypothetical protein